MAKLVNKWLMNEGSGVTIEDSVGNADLTIYPWTTYPDWLDPGPGLRFSGGSLAQGYAYDANNAGTCSTRVGPYAISAFFNLRGITNRTAFGGRLIFASAFFDPTYAVLPQTQFFYRHSMQDFLYIGTGGHAGFSGFYNPGAATYIRGVVGTTDLTGSSDWHQILGYVYPYPTLAGGTAKVEVYLDGLFENSYASSFVRQQTNLRGFLVGSGITWQSGIAYYGGNGPELAASSVGTFPGDIKDLRIHCGYMTPPEILKQYKNRRPMFSCNT